MMVWTSVGDFFNMGGYGLYVWGSVLVTFGFMFFEVVIVRGRKSRVINRMAKSRALELELASEMGKSDAG